MEKNGLRETRKQMFAQMEQRLQEMHPKEKDRMFYYHSSEDRIVLSHALFWVMTQLQCLKGKIRKERFFLLLRQYQEEMLDAFLEEDDYFPELLRYCNILFETLPTILMSTGFRTDKDARKLAAISVVAAGYGGDMDEELCNELLDDMDFHYNKVKCRKIEGMLPKLMKMVESEMEGMRR
ncbi:hypothetical protein [Prevotella communis]|uniref:hypothetical protein n=1 Tax=Prevotella communis TaxID=2913614 RepID=UPI001EDBAE39|nr:hypothetical protein [Prevotella communis]UKK56838.1 hypothetical protein L6476_00855 [Prevotella communis]